MSAEMRSLLEGLLKREVEDRIGCQGNGLVNTFCIDEIFMYIYAFISHGTADNPIKNIVTKNSRWTEAYMIKHSLKTTLQK